MRSDSLAGNLIRVCGWLEFDGRQFDIILAVGSFDCLLGDYDRLSRILHRFKRFFVDGHYRPVLDDESTGAFGRLFRGIFAGTIFFKTSM